MIKAFALVFSAAAGASRPILAFTTPPSIQHHQSIIHQRKCDGDNNLYSTSPASSSFEELGLSPDILSIADRMNWDTPTPVQQLSIPAILNDLTDESTSLWCEGPTGSGKTGAFALPLIQLLLQEKQYDTSRPGQGKIKSLILCPTRELASQIASVLGKFVSHLPNSGRYKQSNDISIDVIYGGISVEAQVARLAKRRRSGDDIDILVATPGRLVDVLKNKENVEPTMSALERRLINALDDKMIEDEYDNRKGKRRSGGRGNSKRGGDAMASSLSLNEIQEMDLDRVDDDGRATMDEMLQGLNYLVLDEADRLLGGTFQDDMAKLLPLFPWVGGDQTTTPLKTLLFSATFPEQIEEKVDRVLSRIAVGTPIRVSTTVAMMQRVPLLTEEGDEEEMSNRQKKHIANTTPVQKVLPDLRPKIEHRVIRLDEKDRTQALRFLLEENENVQDGWDRVLVFVSTRYLTEHISKKLRRYGITAAELHGKLDQDARERRLKAFRAGKTKVLITTDLSARGIDIAGLPVVVNYDLPRSVADFTHRTGRTGRAGQSGSAISFVTARSEAQFDLIERTQIQQQIEREVLEKFPPNEQSWIIESEASTLSIPSASQHSQKGLAHDRMFGGVKGRRKSKKDKLREAASKKKQKAKAQ